MTGTDVPPLQSAAIEVLWELDDGVRVWWPAAICGQDGVLSNGNCRESTIEYEARHGYAKTQVEVVFLSHDVLQHRGIAGKAEAGPPLSWRKRRKNKSRKHGNVSTKERSQRGKSRQGRKGDYSGLDDLRSEMKAIRRSNAKALARLAAVERGSELASSIAQTRGEERCNLECLRTCLRHRLVLQLQRGPRMQRFAKKDNDRSVVTGNVTAGITRTYTRAIADCDLEQFEEIARQCYATLGECKHGPVMFFPSFELTQGASQRSKEFYNLFPTLGSICAQLSVTSTSDMLEMLYRYGRVRGEGAMKVLGSYVTNRNQNAGTANLFIGASCGKADGICAISQERWSSGGRPVLSRERGDWDDADRKFLYPLRAGECTTRHVQICEDVDRRNVRLESFYLRWRRDPDAKPRVWSRSIAHPATVPGTIEVNFPCIQFVGNALCDEFTTLLTPSLTMRSVA